MTSLKAEKKAKINECRKCELPTGGENQVVLERTHFLKITKDENLVVSRTEIRGQKVTLPLT